MELKKKTYIACPDCGTINLATRNVFGRWSIPACAKCGKKIELSEIRQSTVTCDKCGNEVVFDGLSNAPQFCPSCHSQLVNPISKPSYQVLPCPQCGAEVNVKGQTGMVQCPLCHHSFDAAQAMEKRRQQENRQPMLIQYSANTQDILWKHPQNVFPQGSRLIVKEGTAAILLQNGRLHKVMGPGDYPLEDTSLSLTDKLQSPDGSWIYHTDIIFVQRRIAAEYRWGTGYPAEIRDDYGTYRVTANGTLQLRVKDPLALADHLNFTDLAVAESGSGQEESAVSGLIGDLVVQQIGLCFGAPLQELVTRNRWTLQTLTKTDLQTSILPAMNAQLLAFGLQLEPNTFFINDLKCAETDQSAKEKALVDTIQKVMVWSAGTLRIHMKDDPAKYADLTLEGSVQPVVKDRMAFLNSTVGRNLLTSQFSTLEFRTNLNRLLHDLFTQVLQPMVNDTDADIRELGPYYSYLKSTTSDCLNFAMQQMGLVFENVTFEQKAFAPSPALSGAIRDESSRSILLDEQKMRQFTQKIRLVETQETGEYDLQTFRIQVEIGEQKDAYLDRQAALDQKARERQAGMDQQALQLQEDKKAAEMASQARLDALRSENEMAALRKQQEREIAEAEHKVNMRDMLHKIDQSDLSWQEKLDEYARLRKNLGFQDEMEHKTQAAQAEYEARHALLQYTAEEKELMQRSADRDAQREEGRKQAQFERDMTRLRQEWEQKAKLCQMENELEKYKAQLDYLSKADLSQVSFEQAKAAAEREYAERIRAQKERDDASFVSRSNELMSQIRAFRAELDTYPPAMRETAEKVIPGDLINSLLESLQSVVGSVSEALKGSSAPKGGNASFTPGRINKA